MSRESGENPGGEREARQPSALQYFDPRPRSSLRAKIILVVLFAALVAEGVYFVAHGRFNIDEGMHLNAGRLIFENGELPYRDFPFSQGPGGPFAYGAVGSLLGNTLLTGRSLSLLANLVAIAVAAWFAGRSVGIAGSILVVLFTAVNFPALWVFTQIRTEPIAIALTMLAAVAVFCRKGSALRFALAPSLLVWATAFRLTHVMPLLVVCAVVAFELRRSPRMLLATAAIVSANAFLAALPMLAFPQDSFFHVITAQANRDERLDWDEFSPWARFWFFAQPGTDFRSFLVISCFPVFVVVSRWRQGWRLRHARRDDPATILSFLLVLAAATYLPHLFFRVGFATYLVNAVLLTTLAAAIAIPMTVRDARRGGRRIVLVVAAAWLVTATIAVRSADRWVAPDLITVSRFEDLKRTLRELSPNGCSMLTFETYLAVEVSCDVTPGLEYSYFSIFPKMGAREAQQRGVVTPQQVLRRLRRNPPEFVGLTWPAAKKLGLARHSEDEKPMLSEMRGRYRLVTSMQVPVGPSFTFWTEIFVYARTDL